MNGGRTSSNANRQSARSFVSLPQSVVWKRDVRDNAIEQHVRCIVLLQRIITELHSCCAVHLETVDVTETYLGKAVWTGEVEVFSISGHPRANKCYAWIKRSRNKRKRVRIFAVLGTSIIKSPLDAVKFAHISATSSLVDKFSKLVPDDEVRHRA